MYFTLFHYHLPYEMGVVLHFNKLQSPLPKDALCSDLYKIGPVVLEEKISKFRQFFWYFVIISPWEKVRSFLKKPKKLDYPFPKDVFFAKYWPSGS